MIIDTNVLVIIGFIIINLILFKFTNAVIGICFFVVVTGIFLCLLFIKQNNDINKWKEIAKPLVNMYNNSNNKRCGLYTYNTKYRLGDMVNLSYQRDKKDGRYLHFQKYPNSIATEYMKTTDKEGDLNVLFNIVKSRSKETTDLPSKNDIVIHLRTGDVIEQNPNSMIDILSKQTYMNNNIWSSYTPPLSYLNKKIKACNTFGIKNIILVSGSHFDIDTPKSCLYIHCVKKYFENNGYTVKLRLGNNPDDDFIFMCNAKHFVSSTNGGFTKLITYMNIKFDQDIS